MSFRKNTNFRRALRDHPNKKCSSGTSLFKVISKCQLTYKPPKFRVPRGRQTHDYSVSKINHAHTKYGSGTSLSKGFSKCHLTYKPPKLRVSRKWPVRNFSISKTKKDNVFPEISQEVKLPISSFTIQSTKMKSSRIHDPPLKSQDPGTRSPFPVHVMQFQKSPSSYVHLEKSVFTKGTRQLMSILKSDPMRCNCSPRDQQNCCTGSTCLNFASRVLCGPSVCPGRGQCSNSSFHMRAPVRMAPFLTDDGRGWGVRLEEPVRAGEFIIELLGEIINGSTLQKRLESIQKRGEDNYYIIQLTCNLFIDCMFKGNMSRLINSSCEPNCETQKWIDGSTGQTHIGIFAIKDIERGVEITYNYLPTGHCYAEGKANSFLPCRCGAKTCFMRNGQARSSERGFVLS